MIAIKQMTASINAVARLSQIVNEITASLKISTDNTVTAISASAQERYDLFSNEKTRVTGLGEDEEQLTKLANELSEQLRLFKVA